MPVKSVKGYRQNGQSYGHGKHGDFIGSPFDGHDRPHLLNFFRGRNGKRGAKFGLRNPFRIKQMQPAGDCRPLRRASQTLHLSSIRFRPSSVSFSFPARLMKGLERSSVLAPEACEWAREYSGDYAIPSIAGMMRN